MKTYDDNAMGIGGKSGKGTIIKELGMETLM